MSPLTGFKADRASKLEKPRRAWRNRSKAETTGHCSAGIRAAVAALWPPDGNPPAWLMKKTRDAMIRNWLWERRAGKPSDHVSPGKPTDRTIRRYFRERA